MSVRVGWKNPFRAIPTLFDGFSDESASPLVHGCVKGTKFRRLILELVQLNTIDTE